MTGKSTDVVVIGAGPVGLAAAALLGEANVRCVVVERSPSLSTHPRASGVHGRTMEVYRRLGIADAVRAAAVPVELSQGFGWYQSLTGGVVAELRFADDESGQPYPSPEPPCFCPQTHYEPLLLAAANQRPGVQVMFSTTAIGLTQDSTGVTVSTIDSTGVHQDMRCHFVVAADGAASGVREWLELGESGTPVFGHSVNVLFRAEFGPAVATAPYMLFWVQADDVVGTFARASADGSLWTYNFAADPGHQYQVEELTGRIRIAAGMPHVDVEVLGVHRWDYDQSVTDRWRCGRVLLAGDSAHRFPPHGAFGMNSGVQDAENLCWKLAAVLHGYAGDALLDTYEVERKPVALDNGRQALSNTAGLPAPHDAMDAIQAMVTSQRHHLHSLGQQFGNTYVSGAVVPDGTPPVTQTVSEYTASGRPGSRAPHLWLQSPAGRLISTVDLTRDGFAVFATAPGESWRSATKAVTAEYGVPLSCFTFGATGDFDDDGVWATTYGVSDTGAVLVRPDGYVAARMSTADGDEADQLDATIRQLMHRSN